MDSSGTAASTRADAVTATNLEGRPNGTLAYDHGKGTAMTIAVLLAIPAMLVPIVATHGLSAPSPRSDGSLT